MAFATIQENRKSSKTHLGPEVTEIEDLIKYSKELFTDQRVTKKAEAGTELYGNKKFLFGMWKSNLYIRVINSI